MRERDLARGLALAALAGPWEPGAMAARFAVALDAVEEARWMRSLARALCRTCEAPPVDLDALTARIAAYGALRRAARDDRARRAHGEPAEGAPALHVRRWFLPEPRMGERPFDVPPLAAHPEVAALLEVPLDQLDWLADVRGMNRRARAPKLHHYTYRWIAKTTGGFRLIEAPKPRLKRAQRLLLDRVLARLPAHPAACGFVPGRSVLDHARAHVGRRVVVRLDLASFFWSVPAGRVRALFRFLGYPPDVAAVLTGIATTRTPFSVLASLPRPGTERAARDRFEASRRLAHRHLPQGAPTSGALASACAWPLDRRLSGLAQRFGATYTRYADDLAFSGDEGFERDLARLLPRVGAIALEVGFSIRHEKTRVMRSGARQELCGVVVNRQPSLRRAELERLEAILVNCARHGPSTQNRGGHPDWRAHLTGRVAWVRQVAPRKAAALEALLARIDWHT